jgi:CubicO group peptidase (beta-lactamase class C family)
MRHQAGLRTIVAGTFTPDMTPVVEAFAGTVTDPAAGGAALSVWREGEEIVNVHAGVADVRSGRPWDTNTRAVLFSATKGLAAVTVARLSEDLQLDLDAPVASFWPEFAAYGKDRITIRDVLAHRAGLVAPDTAMTLDELVDIRGFAQRLAAQRPLWPQARSHLYHALTWGPLISEIVRRATGQQVPEVFAREIAAPLDAAVSLRAENQDLHHVAHTTMAPDAELLTSRTIPSMGGLAHRMLTAGGALPPTLVADGAGLNDPRVLTAGLISAAGTGTASGLARIWSATIRQTHGVRILRDETVRRLTAVHSEGPGSTDTDADGPFHRWGSGVQLASHALPWLSPASFGHDGAGGQAGFADPTYGVGFGYVTNRMVAAPPATSIIEALRTVLD